MSEYRGHCVSTFATPVLLFLLVSSMAFPSFSSDLLLVDFEPKTGLVIGGTVITANVENLTDTTFLYVGGVACFRVAQDPEQAGALTVSSPSLPPGDYEVKVVDNATGDESISADLFHCTADPFEAGVDQTPGQVVEIEDGKSWVSTAFGSMPKDGSGELLPLHYESPEGIMIDVSVESLPGNAIGAFLIVRTYERLDFLSPEAVPLPGFLPASSPLIDLHMFVQLDEDGSVSTYTMDSGFLDSVSIAFPVALCSYLGRATVGQMETTLNDKLSPELPDPPAFQRTGIESEIVDDTMTVIDVNSLGTYMLFKADVDIDFDLDGDGYVHAFEVQYVINKALGIDIETDYNCDLNADGAVNSADVQIIINYALGIGGCDR